jgi:opacity protein-like surface antigen
MKKSILFALLLSAAGAFSQTTKIETGGNYYFRNYLPSYSDDAAKLDDGTTTKKVNFAKLNKGSRYRITVTSAENDVITFKYWDFNDPGTNNSINGKDKDVLYTLSPAEFKGMMSVLYDRYEFRAGFFSVPYKLRFNDFNFESDVTVGMNISCNFRWNREIEHGFSIEPLIGVGLTKVNTDSSNSKVDEPGSLSAFTVNTGVLLHLTEKINMGVFYGWDNLSEQDYSNSGWEYNGKGWLGIGLNVSFSETDNNKQKDNGTQSK